MKDELIVFVRIALYIAAGRLVAGGWIPEDVAALVRQPATVEAVAGLLVGGAALGWYWVSKARRSLLIRE